jgi:hypothetical protein
MMDTRHSIVPGMSEQQFEVLMLKVKEAVHEAVAEALAQPKCPRQCEDMQQAERDIHDIAVTIHGTPDHPAGLVGRVSDLEGKVSLLIWLAATSATAAIGAVVTLIVTIARTLGG